VLITETPPTRGAASVEHVALVVLMALIAIAAISALVAAPPGGGTRELGGAIARKIVCAPRLPGPCRRHPLARAYGFPLGKLVRALAPAPVAAIGPGGAAMLPVDFRRCRQPGCAAPSGRPGLTASNRRVTAFTAIEDGRAGGGPVRITYWLYRPGLGWERIVREAGGPEIDAAQALRLHVDDVPALVPLETVRGRNHFDFPRSEEPPWRWKVPGIYPG
jgi:hypothetical protein